MIAPIRSDLATIATYSVLIASYIVFGLGKFPGMKIDRPGAAITGAALTFTTGAMRTSSGGGRRNSRVSSTQHCANAAGPDSSQRANQKVSPLHNQAFGVDSVLSARHKHQKLNAQRSVEDRTMRIQMQIFSGTYRLHNIFRERHLQRHSWPQQTEPHSVWQRNSCA